MKHILQAFPFLLCFLSFHCIFSTVPHIAESPDSKFQSVSSNKKERIVFLIQGAACIELCKETDTNSSCIKKIRIKPSLARNSHRVGIRLNLLARKIIFGYRASIPIGKKHSSITFPHICYRLIRKTENNGNTMIRSNRSPNSILRIKKDFWRIC